ncbi:MAG TPA: outer membrane protein assembly factor BamD [Nitrospiria bacterium]|jgi:outer membrane protein assembly factor BamD (BamD/ComL family)
MKVQKEIISIFLSFALSGCLTIQVSPQTPPFNDSSGPLHSLNYAHELFKKKEYSDAEKTFRYVIDTYSLDPLSADARIGLAYTLLYFDNPKRDELKAVKELEQFLIQNPMHPRANEVKNWISFLNNLNEVKIENKRLKDDLQRLIDIDIETEKKRKETQEEFKEPQEKPIEPPQQN